MTTIIQQILVIIALIIAIGYLVLKFIWNPFKKTSSKNCESGTDCGCH